MPPSADPNPPFLHEGAKAAALARFHAGLAHDLNNRLTTILGNLLLFESLYPDEQEALTDMRYAAEQASGLVRLVQTFSRRDSFPPHAVSVNEVLRTLHDLLQRLLGSSCRFSVVLSDGPVYVEGDEGGLEHLLVELMGRSTFSDSVFLRVEEEDSRGVIRCEGAEAPEMDKAFTGLLDFFGAVFEPRSSGWRILFPPCEADTGPLPEPPLPGTGLHILLAEGEPGLRQHMKQALEYRGFEVTAAADTLHVQSLLESGTPFDAAALDVLLPGGGMDALLTSGDLPSGRIWLLPFEGWGTLQHMESLAKPFKPADLHRALLSVTV